MDFQLPALPEHIPSRPSPLAAGRATSAARRKSATSPAPAGQLLSCSRRSCRQTRRCCAPSATQSRGSWGKLEAVWSCLLNIFLDGILLETFDWTYWDYCSKSGGNIKTVQILLFGRCFLGNGRCQRNPVLFTDCPKIWRNASWYWPEMPMKWDQVGINMDYVEMGMV